MLTKPSISVAAKIVQRVLHKILQNLLVTQGTIIDQHLAEDQIKLN